MQNQDRYQQIIEAIELERAQEEAYYKSLALQKTLKEKAAAGVLWYPVDLTKKHYTIGEYVEIVVERERQQDGRHKFRVGAGCVVFYAENDRQELSGTVSFLRRNTMGIILKNDFALKDDIFDKGKIGVELVYNERPYKVMKAAMKEVIRSQNPLVTALREGIRTKDSLSLNIRNIDLPHIATDSNLNNFQI